MPDRLGAMLLMVLGLLGCGFALKRFAKLAVEWIPAILGSIIILWVSGGGILGYLQESVTVFNILGVLLLVSCLFQDLKAKKTIQWHASIKLVLYAAVCLALAFYLKDTVLTHYDNFSHWGTIVKSLYLENSLPDNESYLITFQSYPPGSAAFIYYILQAVGWSEANALTAQALLLIAYALGLLAHISKEQRYVWAGAWVCFCIYLCFNFITVRDLLVDALLAASGLAASVYIVAFRRQRSSGGWAAVMMTACYLIKNSGLFFVVINTILLLSIYLRNNESENKGKQFWRCLPSVLLPWIACIVWTMHTKHSFDYAQESIHAMSFENYAAVLGDKSWQDILQISKAYWGKYAQVKSPEISMLLMWNLLSVAFVIGCRCIVGKAPAGRHMRFILLMDGALLFYAVGLWGMYLLSMPTNEAVTVNGFARYLCCFLIWMNGMSLWYVLHTMESMPHNHQRIVAVLACVCLLALCLGYTFQREALTSYDPQKVNRYDKIVANM